MLYHGMAAKGNTHVHHVDPVYVQKFTRLFIYHIDMNFNSFSYQASCGRVVMTVDLLSGGRAVSVVRILPWTRFFVMFTCSVFLAAGLAAFK